MDSLKIDPKITVIKRAGSRFIDIPLTRITRKGRAKVGVAYSTKDRTNLSRQTFDAAANEPNSDLYWMDGSVFD
jgi:hypothetical protein